MAEYISERDLRVLAREAQREEEEIQKQLEELKKEELRREKERQTLIVPQREEEKEEIQRQLDELRRERDKHTLIDPQREKEEKQRQLNELRRERDRQTLREPQREGETDIKRQLEELKRERDRHTLSEMTEHSLENRNGLNPDSSYQREKGYTSLTRKEDVNKTVDGTFKDFFRTLQELKSHCSTPYSTRDKRNETVCMTEEIAKLEEQISRYKEESESLRRGHESIQQKKSQQMGKDYEPTNQNVSNMLRMKQVTSEDRSGAVLKKSDDPAIARRVVWKETISNEEIGPKLGIESMKDRQFLTKLKEEQEDSRQHVLQRELLDISAQKYELERNRMEKERIIKESEMKLQLMDILERERKEKEELDKMTAILEDREHKLTEKERILTERDYTLYSREQCITDMERKLMDRMELIESDYKRKDNEMKEREHTLLRIEKDIRAYTEHSSIFGTVMRTSGIKDSKIDCNIPTRLDDNYRSQKKEEDSKILPPLDMSHQSKEDSKMLTQMDDSHKPEGKKSWSDNPNVKLSLTYFSGMEPRPRNEATFEEWKLEVESVKAIYSDLVVIQSIRKALKGQAKRIMLHLGPSATVDQILRKLEDAFGNIASKDSILSHFFMAEQDSIESIVEWGLCLEEMLLQASRKATITPEEKDVMLKKRFWRGLRNEELRVSTRVHFESNIQFEELRNKVRAEEYEIQVQKQRSVKGSRNITTNKVQQAAVHIQDDSSKDMMRKLFEKMELLTKKVDEIQKENEARKDDRRLQDNNERRDQARGRGSFRGGNYRGGRGIWEKQPANEEPKQKQENNKAASLNK